MQHNTQTTTARRARAKAVIAGHTKKLAVVSNQLVLARESKRVGGGGAKHANSRVEALLIRRTVLRNELKAARQFA